MKLNVKDQNGVTLHTANKYCEEDIEVRIDTEELNILPSTEDQVNEGLYNKVTVLGSPDLLPENIIEGKEIFGVEGTGKIADFKITSGQYLCYQNDRVDIAQQLVDLCGPLTNMRNMFRDCSNLTEIDVSKLDTSQCTDMSYAFYGCSNLTEIDTSKWNTSNVTKMEDLFSRCPKLTKVDVSDFDTSNVTSMGSMFDSCRNLTEIDVSKWDTSNVIDWGNMFNGCSALTSLDVSNFDTSKVKGYMRAMFNQCSSLTTINLGNWNTSNFTDVGNMFYSCNKLTDLDLSSWDLGKVNYCNNFLPATASALVNLRSFKNLGKGFTQKNSRL